jgi:hypothetical protein
VVAGCNDTVPSDVPVRCSPGRSRCCRCQCTPSVGEVERAGWRTQGHSS